MDQISGLPEAILHDILARLLDRDSARTSVLSKAWKETWSTFPILSICSDQHFKREDVTVDNYHSKIDKVIDYVGRRSLRLRDLGLAIKEFKLIMDYVDYMCMAHHVDLWMKMAIESGGEVLHLQLRLPGRYAWRYSPDRFYELPLCVIESKSLTKLVLMGGIRVDQAFLTHSIKLYSVRIIKLCNLLFAHERIIQRLISRCPLIEDLTVIDCAVYNPLTRGIPRGFAFSPVESLFLHGLHKLKKAYIQGMREVYIDAPNLESLHYNLHPDASFKLNLYNCTNLRLLCLWNLRSIDIGDKWFLKLFSKFPFLESLELDNCSMSQRINISSAQLKVLKLSYCSNLEDLNIDAQNLLSFAYEGNNQPGISFQKSSNQLEVNCFSDVDFRDLYSLRKFVQNIKPQKIWASVSLFIRSSVLIKPEQSALQVSSIPPTIKSLELQFSPKNEAHYFPFINYLLSSCCPNSISLNFRSYLHSKEFIEFLYEILMGRKEGKCHCNSSNTKCWWHALKIVKVICTFKIDENADFKTMLDALPTCHADENIGFILELYSTD
ncbi:putative F-box/FBD/LRR-repeat protein At1g78760 [Arachis duranensis]|uniref:F-box/FBD/LRR-repeat protein At1g78760 n=1 Tax=Arachis duranensis TaxID=130453 RepID=A0A6P4B9H7_ARADU|nr:putative F-box/FBD/LRR-repeat protein At1g78760 [Arachis duranensis]